MKSLKVAGIYNAEKKSVQTNDSEKKNRDCDSDYQLSGKLLKIDWFYHPCAYPFIEVLDNDGNKQIIYNESSDFKVGNKKPFRWPEEHIYSKIDHYEDLPSGAFELTLINKSYFFCCYKQSLNCGGLPILQGIIF